jgi:predicted TIM-barrel fold metal-dependent hydrolase
MIIDSHVYCFPPIDSPAGHPNGEEHLRWVQVSYAGHHQPAWRVRDRAPASSAVLAPQGRSDLSRLPDVDFRVDSERGRAVWTIDGEDYTKQYFPPNLRNMEFTPHSLIAEMDYAGVDVGLIHTDPMLLRGNGYLAECVRSYPNRLRSMAPVDEWRIKTETDAVISEVIESIKKSRLHAIKFIPPLAYMSGPDPWDDGFFRPFWEAAVSLGVPVFFTMGSGPEQLHRELSAAEQRAGYLHELRILMRWMERYPKAICSLTHGFPWRAFFEGNHENQIILPEEIWEPFKNANCSLEVCFPIRLGDLFDFPYREVWPAFRKMVQRIGPDRLLWGTDMPFQNRFCTYRQSRHWIEKHCDFLSEGDLAKIMGGTAARILGL